MNNALKQPGLHFHIPDFGSIEPVIKKMLKCRINIAQNAKLLIKVHEDWDYKLVVGDGTIGDLREEGVYHILIDFQNKKKKWELNAKDQNHNVAQYSLEYNVLDTEFTVSQPTEELCVPTEFCLYSKSLIVAMALEKANLLEVQFSNLLTSKLWKQALALHIDIILSLKKELCYDEFGFLHARFLRAYNIYRRLKSLNVVNIEYVAPRSNYQVRSGYV